MLFAKPHVIDSYITLEEFYAKHTYLESSPKDWSECSKCGIKPMLWIYDNGRDAQCACSTKYGPSQAKAESVSSCLKRTGGFSDYDEDELMRNWNHYAETGVVVELDDGRW